MKQRTTFLSPEYSRNDFNQIKVGEDHLNLTFEDDVAQESRYTFGLSELPTQLRTLADDLHELHVRWTNLKPYESRIPSVSQTPPGLHVFYTPRTPDAQPDLCGLLHALFSPDLKCSSTTEAFSSPPVLSERFTSSSSYQYYSLLPDLDHLKTYAQTQLCGQSRGETYAACNSEAEAISQADYLDIDFDIISHAVTLTAYWSPSSYAEANLNRQSTTIKKLRPTDSVEVGVLQPAKPEDLEELRVGGYLTVLGQDTKPSTTLFSFPSRHHPHPNSLTYTPHFPPPTGLHPTLALTFPHPPQPPTTPFGDPQSCSLHAYLTLPSPLFLDPYTYTDPLFLAAHNLRTLRALSGETDLEAPEWTVPQWGSAILLELATPSEGEGEGEWTAMFPLHLRYLASQAGASHAHLAIPHPAVFYACHSPDGTLASNNPFDRTNLGYDGLFGARTSFWHIPSTTSNSSAGGAGLLLEELQVPVLDVEDGGWLEERAVRLGTLAFVVAGFVWVVWGIFRDIGRVAGRGRGDGGGKQVEGKKEN